MAVFPDLHKRCLHIAFQRIFKLFFYYRFMLEQCENKCFVKFVYLRYGKQKKFMDVGDSTGNLYFS